MRHVASLVGYTLDSCCRPPITAAPASNTSNTVQYRFFSRPGVPRLTRLFPAERQPIFQVYGNPWERVKYALREAGAYLHHSQISRAVGIR
jgi:hypothetical protein